MIEHYISFSLLILAVFFITLLLLIECGKRIALRRIHDDPTGAKVGVSEVEGAIFALLGLMIAFTFYGAAQRLDIRRQMIVNETNAIGTAWLRIDLLPDDAQKKMRSLFKQYADSRLAVNQKLPDITAAKQQIAIANGFQDDIWKLAISAEKNAPNPMIAVIVLPSLNSMFDIATSHNVAMATHPPLIIFITLVLLILISAFYVGYSLAGGKHTNWLHGIGYAFVMVGIFYVIIDFEFPRLGFIHLKNFDQPLIELRNKME